MDYESFKADLTSALEDLGYSRENIAFSETQKNNGVTNRTITVRNDLPIAPNINLEGFIEDVANGKDISEIADRIDELVKSQPDFSQTDFSLTWDRVKDNVVFVLVNGETNKDLLDKAPHVRFLDFAMIYKIDTRFINIPGFITVNNGLMETLHADNKMLLDAALKNTPELMPAYVDSMRNVMSGLLSIPVDEDIDMGVPDIVVASNKDKTYGATAMLYSGFESRLGEMGIEDCYVIPSSVHECLMVTDGSDMDRENLENMVREVNASDCVSDTEFLSNKVYRYSEIRKGFDEAIAREMSNYMAENKGVRGEIEAIKADMAEITPDALQKNMKK
jgi:hypothetical protein